MSVRNPPRSFPSAVCWESESRQVVMDTEALRAHISVFNATHSPCELRRAGSAVGSLIRVSEQEYLEEFLHTNDARGLDFAVGDSGSGKSHLIRWMATQIEQRTAESDKWHVVLVPRASANLSSVIRTIWKGFQGERIADIEQRLAQSNIRMTDQGARVRVLQEIAFVLDPNNVRDVVIKSQLTGEERDVLELLPSFLNEPSVKKKLADPTDGIVARLAEHIGGTRTKATDASAELLRWTADQLLMDATDVLRISPEHSPEAHELAVQLQTDSQIREVAAELLTSAWAPALGQLLGLRRGDLDEAMREIRRQLKSEGKELVLLIEDLSVAHGVDNDLVEALLIGAQGSGESLCKLRSIVGVTNEDYERLQENIANRARETIFFNVTLDNYDDDGVTDEALLVFAARYLNAARYSVEELDEWSQSKLKASLGSFCQESSCPNRSLCHETFGTVTIDGQRIGLYPFTRENLPRLYRATLRSSDTVDQAVAFNPRRMVSRVLNEVLKEAETAIPKNEFPTLRIIDSFRLKAVPVHVQQQLREKYGKDAVRILRCLEMYTPASKRPSVGIGTSFALPIDTSEATKKTPEIIEKDSPLVDAIPTERPTLAEDEYDRWVNTGELPDRMLNKWRNQLHKTISAYIDWDSTPLFSLLKSRFGRRNIYIEGQEPDESPGDIRLRIERDAQSAIVLRFLEKGPTSTSDIEVDDILLYTAETISTWADHVIDQMHSLRNSAVTAPTALECGAQILVLGAMLRGLVDQSTPPEIALQYAFQAWPKPHESMDVGQPETWKALLNQFQRYAPAIQKWLHECLASTKGGDFRAGFIDPSPIIAAISRVQKTGEMDSLPNDTSRWFADESLIPLAREVGRRLPQVINEGTKAFKATLKQLDDLLGDDDPGRVIAHVCTSLQIAVENGVLRGANSLEIVQKSNLFGGTEYVAAISSAKSTAKASSFRIDTLAGIAWASLKAFIEYLVAADEVVSASLSAAENGDEDESESIDQLVKEIDGQLKELVVNLKRIAR